MFSKQHRQTASHSTRNSEQSAPLVSPLQSPSLQLTFDFEIDRSAPSPVPNSPSPFSPIEPGSSSPARPSTSHGLAPNTARNDWSSASRQLQPPTLPPIPREASTRSISQSIVSNDSRKQETRARDESDNFSTRSRKSLLQPRLSFEHPVDMLPSLSRPGTPLSAGASVERPQTRGSYTNGPLMESSLFPPKNSRSVSTPISNVPVMSRQFIDSRDKPYSQPPPKPLTLQQNHSSPDLLRTKPSVLSPKLPTPTLGSSKALLSPRPSLQNLSQGTNYSGSTARPSTQASTFTANSSEPGSTIGTPYQETVDSFPLPQIVATRPKTSGPSSTIGGVAVLTHHTSTPKAGAKSAEKRKTRLLNPLALLQRRRSNQDPENAQEEKSQRQAHAQALARQRDVAASGVSKPPEDFDPRIKGKVVHDFSAPRRKRNTFDEFDGDQNSENSPYSPSIQMNVHPPRNSSLGSRDAFVEGIQRRSTHTPVFVEHLAENPEAHRRISSIQAESLENKDFLQRASKQSSMTTYSQESAVLPPFARRSQILDPTQAALYQDDDSRRSSDPSSGKERESSLGSINDVSPLVTQSNHPTVDIRSSMSPVSPGSPAETFRPPNKTTQAQQYSTPVLGGARLETEGSSYQFASDVSKHSSQEQKSLASPADVNARPYSVVLAPPTFSAIAEGSTESSPVEPSTHQMPQVVARGLSIRQSDTAGHFNDPSQGTTRSPSNGDVPTPERTPEPKRVTSIQFKPAKGQPKLVEKRASAVGHSRKSSRGPKHHPSNASRFSFQYGNDGAALEQALEEKHRKLRTSEMADSYPRSRSPSEGDEDDYFDEDAMDDLDEMEMQEAQQSQDPMAAAPVPIVQMIPPASVDAPSQSATYLQQARQMLQEPESDDDESAFGDGLGPSSVNGRDSPYGDQSAFYAPSALGNHTRQSSYQTTGEGGYWRGSTIDYYMNDPNYPYGHSRMQSQASEFNFTGASPMGPQGTHQDYQMPLDGLPPSLVAESEGFSEPQVNASPSAVTSTPVAKPPLPHRDSGNSERNRVASGMSFGSPSVTPGPSQQPSWSDETAESRKERITSGDSYASRSDAARTSQATASALSMSTAATSYTSGDDARVTSGFSLGSPIASPDLKKASLVSEQRISVPRNDSVGESLDAAGQPSPRVKTIGAALGSPTETQTVTMQGGHSRDVTSMSLKDELTTTSLPPKDGVPELKAAADTALRLTATMGSERFGSNGLAGFDFDDVGGLPAKDNVSQPRTQPGQKSSGRPSTHQSLGNENDDMYFDDGNFDQDIDGTYSGGIDENAFDDDSFLARPGMLHAVKHQRNRSSAAFTTASLSSDGPYPSFAMPNAPRVSQRYSQMMLEDLPLQAPVDPKYIPQRNPSEDAKRLGLTDRVPPVPVPESDEEAYRRMKAKLESYHAALAEAANKAALEGRFLRMPSTSTARSSSNSSKMGHTQPSFQVDTASVDGESVYSEGEGGGEIFMPYNSGDNGLNVGRAGSHVSHLSHLTTYSPPRMSFDFGFEQSDDAVDDSMMNDDDLVAAANAEALANDEDGFYGQEFDFYGRPRANSNELETMHGGYFGQDGDDGLARNRSLKEPNLTPITERSEFSTRNSFIGLGVNPFGPASAGPYSPQIARMPITPLMEGEINSFDELRKLRANAFGDAGSLRSSSNRSSSHSLHMLSPTGSARPGQGHFPPGAPMQFQYSSEGSSASAPASAHPPQFHESPQSAASNRSLPFALDADATPKRNNTGVGVLPPEPTTARKLPPVQTGMGSNGHSRNGSGADSVTYIRTPDPEGSGKPRWVLERRRTSEQGQLEVIGRELVQGGWI